MKPRRGAAAAALLATAAAALLAGGGAAAHHAWTEIDTTKSLTLTGVVDALRWENPHASLRLAVRDGDRDVVWAVEMSGIARMEARGLTADQLAKGHALVIVASPSRTEPRVVRANTIRVDGKDHVLY